MFYQSEQTFVDIEFPCLSFDQIQKTNHIQEVASKHNVEALWLGCKLLA